MKKISYYIFAALMCATSLSSCSDMLEEESAVEVDKSKYMNNASEAETVLLGVYRNMVTDALYSYNLSILFNITNDIAQCEGNSTNAFREIPANAFTTSNSSVQSTWSTLYNSIYNANDFIETLESKVGNYTEGDKKLANMGRTSDPQIFVESIFPKAFGDAAMESYTESQDTYTALFEDQNKYNAIMSALAEVIYREMRKKK